MEAQVLRQWKVFLRNQIIYPEADWCNIALNERQSEYSYLKVAYGQ